jgi:hypothetical protein
MKKLIPLLFLLFLLPLSFADDDEDALGQWSEDAMDFVQKEGETFRDASISAAHTPIGAAETVYDAFSPGYCGEEWVSDSPGSVFSLWFAPAALMAMVVFFGIGGIYMMGQLLSSPNLVAIAKEEFWQSLTTLLRIVFIAAIIFSGNMWFAVSTGGTTDPVYKNKDYMIDAAMAFSRNMISDMIGTYSLLLIYNTAIHTIYSSTMWVGVSFRAMYNFNLGPVLKPIIDIIGTSLQYLSLAISEWMVHTVVLCFIKRWTWGLFVPLAIFLRAIPFTRNAGEALLSLTLALAIIYPLMFLVSYEAHKLMSLSLADSHGAVSAFITQSGIFSIAAALFAIVLFAAGVIFPVFLGGAVTIAFELVRNAVYYIVIMSMMLPFLNIFITLTLAREWAKIFNVTVNYLSFLKII